LGESSLGSTAADTAEATLLLDVRVHSPRLVEYYSPEAPYTAANPGSKGHDGRGMATSEHPEEGGRASLAARLKGSVPTLLTQTAATVGAVVGAAVGAAVEGGGFFSKGYIAFCVFSRTSLPWYTHAPFCPSYRKPARQKYKKRKKVGEIFPSASSFFPPLYLLKL